MTAAKEYKIYVARFSLFNGLIKVGKSTDVTKRLSKLSLHYGECLGYTLYSTSRKDIEGNVSRLFRKHKKTPWGGDGCREFYDGDIEEKIHTVIERLGCVSEGKYKPDYKRRKDWYVNNISHIWFLCCKSSQMRIGDDGLLFTEGMKHLTEIGLTLSEKDVKGYEGCGVYIRNAEILFSNHAVDKIDRLISSLN